MLVLFYLTICARCFSRGLSSHVVHHSARARRLTFTYWLDVAYTMRCVCYSQIRTGPPVWPPLIKNVASEGLNQNHSSLFCELSAKCAMGNTRNLEAAIECTAQNDFCHLRKTWCATLRSTNLALQQMWVGLNYTEPLNSDCTQLTPKKMYLGMQIVTRQWKWGTWRRGQAENSKYFVWTHFMIREQEQEGV